MAYDRYKIFNLEEIQERELVNISFDFFLDGIGLETIQYFKGFQDCVLIREEILPIQFNGENPVRKNGVGVWIDTTTNDVYAEYEVVEE